PLGGRPVLHWSLEAMEQAPSVEEVVVVAGEEDVDRLRREVSPLFAKVTAVVAGGATRQESVARGLRALTPSARWVVVHDGVRPMAGGALVERGLEGARKQGAATAAGAVAGIIKRGEGGGGVERTQELGGRG